MTVAGISSLARLVRRVAPGWSGRLSWRRRSRDLTLLAVLGALLYPTISAAPRARADAPVVIVGAAGPLQPPAAALQATGAAGDGTHGLGLTEDVQPGLAPRIQSGAPAAGAAALPASADLSADSPPVGDQGSLASCVSWVTGYYMRGWYAKRDGYYPSGGPDGNGGFAPMYLFSKITGGKNTGTTFNANLDLEQGQGIDTRADYTQGDTDYADLPTSAETANAASYKIAGYTTLFVGPNQGASAQQAIEASITGGDPVGIGLPVYDNLWNADASHYYIDVSNLGPTNHGNHAVTAFKYDANGLWVENQWGTGWGLNGWAELSWAFVNTYVWQAMTMHVGTALPPAATATSAPAIPTATNTALPLAPAATATPAAPSATNTTTPLPAATSTVTPAAPAATSTSAPAATATPQGPQTTSARRLVLPTATTTPHAPLPRTARSRPAVAPARTLTVAQRLTMLKTVVRHFLKRHPVKAHLPSRGHRSGSTGRVAAVVKAARPEILGVHSLWSVAHGIAPARRVQHTHAPWVSLLNGLYGRH